MLGKTKELQFKWCFFFQCYFFPLLAKLRRIQEVEYPLHVSLLWEADRIDRTRFVLQENENGEIDVRQLIIVFHTNTFILRNFLELLLF